MPFSRAGQLARPVPTARLTDSLGLVAENLRASPHGVVPVLDRLTLGDGEASDRATSERKARVVGLIDVRDLARAMAASNAALNAPVPVGVPVFGADFEVLGGYSSNGHEVDSGYTESNGYSNGSANGHSNGAAPKPWQELTAREVMRADVPHIPSVFSLENALSTFDRYERDALPVLDEVGGYRGVVSRADVIAALAGSIRPPMVGGMATPLGVYLSNGVLSGGAPPLGLFLSGLTLAACYAGATLVLTILLYLLNPSWGAAASSGQLGIILDGSGGLNSGAFLLHSLLFLLSFRVIPLSGVHAAEHQTVHALERGLPLETEIVAQMPRAHPRCGTNLIALVGLVTIGLVHLPSLSPDWILLVLIVTFFAWRSLGTLIQENFTTRRATKKQLESGIKAAKELMAKYQAQPFAQNVSPFRILNGGMLYSALGMTLGVNVLLNAINWLALRLIG